jgi:predicted nucleic-acid-binding protein
MIALDTNVLVRFLTQDEPAQARAAADLLSGLTGDRPGFICREVLVELVWVLERAYKFSSSEIAHVLEGLLSATELVVEEADSGGAILQLYGTRGFGFADLMIRQASRRSGAQYLATFDRRAAVLEGVELVGPKPQQ